MMPIRESLSAAENHLLRLGPGNARTVQAKIREFAGTIEVTPR